MKYVYCLTDTMASIDTLPPGLGGAAVCQVSFKGISALISEVDPAHLIGDARNALAHQRVIQGMLARSTSVIPCRFGALFADEQRVLALLKTHYTRLEANLTRLRDRVEMGVTVLVDGTEAPVVRTLEAERFPEGARYLLGKRHRYDVARALSMRAECLARALNAATAPLWADVNVGTRARESGLLLSLSYLLDRENLSAFMHAYQQFQDGQPGLKLLCSGPWPPYSFADIDLRHERDTERSSERRGCLNG